MRYSRLGYWGATAAGLVFTFAGMAAVMAGMPAGVSWVKFLALSAVAVGGVTIVLFAYRSADEVMLSEHKTAWFWGSMICLAFAAPLVVGVVWQFVPPPMLVHAIAKIAIASGIHPSTRGIPIPSAMQQGFVEGVMFIIIAQVVAFLAVWAWMRWRPARR